MNHYEMALRALGGIPSSKTGILPLDDSAMRAVETEIGQTLPAPYREFFRSCGGYKAKGGLFARVAHPLLSRQDVALEVFFGQMKEGPYDLLETYRSFKGIVPVNFLPISQDGSGSLVGIVVSGPMSGAVYYWDADDEPEESTPIGAGDNDENVYLMAHTLDDFIESLETEEVYILSMDTLLQAEEVVATLLVGDLAKLNGPAALSRELQIIASDVGRLGSVTLGSQFEIQAKVSVQYRLRVGGKANTLFGIDVLTDALTKLLNSMHGDAIFRSNVDIFYRTDGKIYLLRSDIQSNASTIINSLSTKLNVVPG